MLMILVTIKMPSIPMPIIYLTLYNMPDSHLWSLKACQQLLLVFTVSVSLKVVLMPAYFSTDQDVHQNWLRITSNKPLEEWYYDVLYL
jgi:hypothetical protein